MGLEGQKIEKEGLMRRQLYVPCSMRILRGVGEDVVVEAEADIVRMVGKLRRGLRQGKTEISEPKL